MRQDYLYDASARRLMTAAEAGRDAPADGLTTPIWTDLLEPTPDDITALEVVLGVDLPSRADMREIEPSSRIYSEDGALFMTANVLAGAATQDPVLDPVTFVLTPGRVVSIRYHDPVALQNVPQRALALQADCSTPVRMLMTLMEVLVERCADILEVESTAVDSLSRQIFQPPGQAAPKAVDLSAVITRIGRHNELNARLQDSLVTIERIVTHVTQMRLDARKGRDGMQAGTAAVDMAHAGGLNGRDKRLVRDIRSLIAYAEAQSQRVSFMLDATLGLLNIQQNGIIKIFSVAAVVFLPPTLIASIYGMNFVHMPELAAPYGYPVALGGMVLSAILPYWFFKRKGWL
jgi:magnesium transporter